MIDIGNLLDREPERSRNYALLAILHHHPIPVQKSETPSWLASSLSALGVDKVIEQMKILEDAPRFLRMMKARRIVSILHGHKHIPRYTFPEELGMAVIGCGSTVGKGSDDGEDMSLMSFNIVTIDHAVGRMTGCLRAEGVEGGGFDPNAEKKYEVLYRSEIPAQGVESR